eukprot:COSAG01_NODE_10748_length_2088_cov_9.736048_1_plen_33_part_10
MAQIKDWYKVNVHVRKHPAPACSSALSASEAGA